MTKFFLKVGDLPSAISFKGSPEVLELTIASLILFFDHHLNDPVALPQPVEIVLKIADLDLFGVRLGKNEGGLGVQDRLEPLLGEQVAIPSRRKIPRNDIHEKTGNAGAGHMGGDSSPHNAGT